MNTSSGTRQNRKSNAKALTLMIQATVFFAIALSGSNLQASIIQYDLVNVQDSAIGASITGFIDWDTASLQFTQGYDLFVAPNATLGNTSTLEFNAANFTGNGSDQRVFFFANTVNARSWVFFLQFPSGLGTNPADTLTLTGNSYISSNSPNYALTGAVTNDAVASAPEPATTSLLLIGTVVLIGGNRLRRYRPAAVMKFTESR
jgi:hypothetical protein